MEISDAQKEREAVTALRDAESRVNHSVCLMSLCRMQMFRKDRVFLLGINHFSTRSGN